jgi:hypothetical protein
MRRKNSLSQNRTGRAARTGTARQRGLAAIKRVRRGQSKNLSSAARAVGTTVRTIKKLLPAALIPGRPGRRIRVKAGDSYSARVEILEKDAGPNVVTARGSRQRDLAGQHRAVYNRVLKGLEPPSALDQFRGKQVGGHELLSDYDRLRLLAGAGVLGQLDTLYVSPDVSV